MKVVSYEKLDKGCLIGSIDINIPEWRGLVLRGIKVFKKGNRSWFQTPQRNAGDYDNPQWVPHFEFDKEGDIAFQTKLKELAAPFFDLD